MLSHLLVRTCALMTLSGIAPADVAQAAGPNPCDPLTYGAVGDGITDNTAAIQTAMVERNAAARPEQRIELRIGVHQGDVIVEDGDIFGDGVNIAARLEGLAMPGGICVSARVQEDVAGKVDLAFADIGEQRLKNIARPVRAYRLLLKALTPAVPTTAAEPSPRL